MPPSTAALPRGRDGFYEWKAEASGKVPHLIRMRSHKPFGIAGLWEGGGSSSEILAAPTALVLTCAPNEMMATLHNRMPVILKGDAAERWLNPLAEVAELNALLEPFPADLMEASRCRRW